MHQSIPPAPTPSPPPLPPPATAQHLPALSVPGVRHLQILHLESPPSGICHPRQKKNANARGSAWAQVELTDGQGRSLRSKREQRECSRLASEGE